MSSNLLVKAVFFRRRCTHWINLPCVNLYVSTISVVLVLLLAILNSQKKKRVSRFRVPTTTDWRTRRRDIPHPERPSNSRAVVAVAARWWSAYVLLGVVFSLVLCTPSIDQWSSSKSTYGPLSAENQRDTDLKRLTASVDRALCFVYFELGCCFSFSLRRGREFLLLA